MFWRRTTIEIHWSLGSHRLDIILKSQPDRMLALFSQAIGEISRKLGIDDYKVVMATEDDPVPDPPPIEDVVEELAAEVPAEDWDKLARDPRTIADAVAKAMSGQTDWDSFRSFAATIPDDDWAKLLAARDEEESG